jgi:DNA-binding transcriptional MerR regulator
VRFVKSAQRLGFSLDAMVRFSKLFSISLDSVHNYGSKLKLSNSDSKGQTPDKPYGSMRRYGETDVTRVRFVKSAQRLGFSLDEIAELLRLEDGTHCEEASSLAEHKLKDVRERMADLARMAALHPSRHSGECCRKACPVPGASPCADRTGWSPH